MSSIVPKRVSKAIQEYSSGDFESALLHICPAIDATTKLEFPTEKKVTTRYKKFLHINTGILTWSFLNVYVFENMIVSSLNHPDIKTDDSKSTKLEDILYHVIRCGVVHGDDIGKYIEFSSTVAFKQEAGRKIVLGTSIVLGMILCVILSPANFLNYLDGDKFIEIYGTKYPINELWGQRDLVIGIITKSANIS